MSFEEPWRLAILVAPVALLVAYVVAQRARRKYALRFTSVDLLASVAPKRPGLAASRLRRALMLAAVSRARLRLRQADRHEECRAPARAAIMLAIDTSGSMAATDVAPSRLVAAQDAARRFIDGLPHGPEDRRAVVRHQRPVLAAPTLRPRAALAGGRTR